MDHDQRFKMLLETLFADFMRLFFAPWAEHIDFDSVEFLKDEVFLIPPTGQRGTCDLVARVKVTKPVEGMHAPDVKEWLVILHVEIDSSGGTVELKSKLPYYYFPLRSKYQLPVLPIALFLKVGLDGIGEGTYEEWFWGFCTLRLNYLYVGLPALDAVQYFEGDNWLGLALASLMRIPKERVVELGAEAFRRIQNADLPDQTKFLLGECIEAYLPADEEQVDAIKGILRTDTRKEIPGMRLTSYDYGMIANRNTFREILKRRSEKKFETDGLRWFDGLPAELDDERIGELLEAVGSSATIRDLEETANRILGVTAH